ncbi:MAG: 50S ribosomal protein L13 [Saprospiraceae bacterium]|nr:50S ribosomal protein L13 [Saprospiraceae bacterium]
MNTLSYKTKSANKETVERNWYIVDAEDQIVGRLATKIATVLRGKHKPSYTPHVDTGDCIIVINAEKIKFTGSKMEQKEYITYSGYPGGQKRRTAKEMMAKKPITIIENAVRGMLPKTRLGRAMFKKLFVYTGTEHPHGAQKPETFNF